MGLAVAGWGISILLSDISPLPPWVSRSLISIGSGFVVAGVAWLLVAWWVMSRRNTELPAYENTIPLQSALDLNDRGIDAYNKGQANIAGYGSEEAVPRVYRESFRSMVTQHMEDIPVLILACQLRGGGSTEAPRNIFAGGGSLLRT